MFELGVAVVENVLAFVKKVLGNHVITPEPFAIKSTDSPRQIVVSLLIETLGAETSRVT